MKMTNFLAFVVSKINLIILLLARKFNFLIKGLRLLKRFSIFLFIVAIFVILGLSLRGLPGNPTANELNDNKWKDDGFFELSPERGRFALAYTLIEDKSFYFSLPIARFATPDLGYKDGKYVSLFAPGVSFLVGPGYLLGKYFGISQLGTVAVITLFAIINAILIRAIAIRLGANRLAASIAALVFIFATPAFTYAVTLYQHHISVFLILLSIYTLLKFKSIWSLAITWFLAVLSISVDYPNFFMMFPVVLYALGRFIVIDNNEQKVKISLKYLGVITFLAAVVPLLFFLWFNNISYGNPFQLAGTVASVKEIDSEGKPTVPKSDSAKNVSKFDSSESQNRTAVNFFQTRNMLGSLSTHFLSPDRGVIFYTPVILFGILGIILAIQRKIKSTGLLFSVLIANIVLYSMWGDFWGGWAFGSRYLIPGYAISAIFIGLLLTYWRKKTLFLIFFFIILSYSISVNTLGAITSSRNPPQVEVLGLEKLSGRQEKYTYERNIDFLIQNRSKSFIFQTFAKNYITAVEYYYIVSSTIILLALSLLITLRVKYIKN